MQPAEQVLQLGVDAGDADLEAGHLAQLADAVLDLGLHLGHHLLDAGGVDAAVGHQALQGEPRDLAAHRIEAREDHGLGRVVDDDVHAGDDLEGADVAALAPDDAALHVVAGQVHHRDRDLGDVVGGEALDGEPDDLARLALGVALRGLADLGHAAGGLGLGLVLDVGHEAGARLLGAHAGDALELDASGRR